MQLNEISKIKVLILEMENISNEIRGLAESAKSKTATSMLSLFDNGRHTSDFMLEENDTITVLGFIIDIMKNRLEKKAIEFSQYK